MSDEFRQALRYALENHVGFDARGAVMLKIEAGRFQMLAPQP